MTGVPVVKRHTFVNNEVGSLGVLRTDLVDDGALAHLRGLLGTRSWDERDRPRALRVIDACSDKTIAPEADHLMWSVVNRSPLTGVSVGSMDGLGRVLGLLVTFNRPTELANHLDVLSRQTIQLDELLVVDNGDDPNVQEAIERHRPTGVDTEILRTGANLGPAGAIQMGMEHLLETAGPNDWIVLLDDDDPPHRDDALEQLVGFAYHQTSADPSVGVVGGTGTRFDRRRGRIRRVPDAELSGVVDVDYVAGGQLPLISVAAIRTAGPFRGDLFFGFDDLEFGLRVRDAGWRIVLDGDLAHWSRARAGRLGRRVGGARLTRAGVPWRRYYSVRNLVAIERWHGTWWGALRVSLVVGVAKPLAMCVRSPRRNWPHLVFGLRAVSDAWTGRMGRRVDPVVDHGVVHTE